MDLQTISDVALFQAICEADMERDRDEESDGCNWCGDSPWSYLEREYERRYGVAITPYNERGATWAIYHCPPGWRWQCTLATRPDMDRANRGYHATRSVTVTARTRPATESKAEAALADAIRQSGCIDSGIREATYTLVVREPAIVA